MGFLFGIGLAVASIFILPGALLLALAFVYVRVHRGQPVDLNTGATAYVVILVSIAAIIMTSGVANLLRPAIGSIDEDYTYTSSFFSGSDFNDFNDNDDNASGDTDRKSRDVASGVGLVLAGSLIVFAHLALWSWLRANGHWDVGAERAWTMVVTLMLALFVVTLLTVFASDALERIVADEGQGVTPGASIALLIPFAALWAIYGRRALGDLRFAFGTPAEPAE